MPTSDPRQLAPIVQELARLSPVSVLDAGAGYGKYGPLIREYLDDWQWRMRLVAVEPFSDYVERSNAFRAYDLVFETTIEAFVAGAAGRDAAFDVVLLVDVLEHFDHDTGAEILRRLTILAPQIVVATPREPSDQYVAGVTEGDPGHYPYGNELEAHMSRWTEAMLGDVLPIERFVPVPGDEQIVVTLGRIP